MTKSTPTKQVSFRVPEYEYKRLQQNANAKNKSLSELARDSVINSNRAISLQDELRQVEARLTRKLFLMSCAIANLDREAAKVANNRYNELLAERGR